MNIVFSFLTRKEDFKQFAFTRNGQCYTFRVLFLSYVNSPSFCHDIVQRHLEHLDIPQKITLIYIHNIMLIGPDKQELVRTLEALGRHTYIPFHRMIQRPNTSVRSVVVQSLELCQDILFKVKTNYRILHLLPQRMKHNSLMSWGLHIPHLGIWLCPLYRERRKAVSFEWGLKAWSRRQLFWRSKLWYQWSYHLDYAPLVSEISVMGKEATRSLWENHMAPWDSEAGHCHLLKRITHHLKTTPVMFLSPGRTEACPWDMSDHAVGTSHHELGPIRPTKLWDQWIWQ